MKLPDQFPPQSPEKFKFNLGVATVANERHPEKNEDAFLSLSQKGSFAVFDGLGGRAAGEVASSTARDYLKKSLEALPDNISLEERKIKIKQILKDANSHVLHAGVGDLYEMATTVSFVQFCENSDGMRKVMVANAGDSRVYILRSNRFLEKATVDDNKFSPELRDKFDNLIDPAQLTDQETGFWQKRNQISNMLGSYDFEPRISVFELKHDDVIIITSDGIHDNLTSKEITEMVLGREDSSIKANKLIEAAQKRSREKNFRSKEDDMTALVISQMS